MKKVLTLSVALAVISVAAWACGCSSKDAAKDEHAGHDMQGMKMDAKAGSEASAEAKAYPLDYCLVTGEKLGSMGDPVTLVYEGQTFKFCCNGCASTFKKDPAKWAAKLKEAVAAKKDKDPQAGHQH